MSAEKDRLLSSAKGPPDCSELRIGSLCSGYGGLDLGLMQVVGGSVAWHVENDRHPAAVLAAHWPDVPNYCDVMNVDWSTVEPVDWLTAGYPCQPFSLGGKRRGTKDDRHLWPYIAGAIGVLRPARCFFENVAGHVSLGLGDVLADLAKMGYDTTWGVVRADEAGAPHERARLFILAADTRRERHGSGQDTRSVGRVDGEDAGQAQERQRARQQPLDRGSAASTDPTGDGRDEGRAESAGLERRSDASERGLSVVPDAERVGRDGGSCEPERRSQARTAPAGSSEVDWQRYAAAVRRWERVTGRSAPHPTVRGKRGGHSLSPYFDEWLMGLPEGWVTDVLDRQPALKACGNGVVPQQAALALRTLLDLEAVA